MREIPIRALMVERMTEIVEYAYFFKRRGLAGHVEESCDNSRAGLGGKLIFNMLIDTGIEGYKKSLKRDVTKLKRHGVSDKDIGHYCLMQVNGFADALLYFGYGAFKLQGASR